MAMLSETIRLRRENPTARDIARRIQHGVSPNYQGDYRRKSNQPANIPDSENCSLWITELPADLTYHELLGAVKNAGRVWQTVINLPDGSRHQKAAAKLTFFTPEEAQALLARSNRHGTGLPGLLVRNHRGLVRHNRNRVPRAVEPDNHSRVVVIKGPKEIVNVDYLSAFFRAKFRFETDEILPWVTGQVINILEWRFGSYRCQAQSA
jgi:hypothetical protein